MSKDLMAAQTACEWASAHGIPLAYYADGRNVDEMSRDELLAVVKRLADEREELIRQNAMLMRIV